MDEEFHGPKMVKTFRISRALLEMVKAEYCRRNMRISPPSRREGAAPV
jgi:hypothetical protein